MQKPDYERLTKEELVEHCEHFFEFTSEMMKELETKQKRIVEFQEILRNIHVQPVQVTVAPKLTNFEKVKQFHAVFNKEPDPTKPIRIEKEPTDEQKRMILLRKKLVTEEFVEAMYEFDNMMLKKDRAHTNIMALMKELADILYVVYGTAAAFGIDLDDVFSEVHDSNMSKLDEAGNPIYREDGKVLKGPHYKEPDMYYAIYVKKAAANFPEVRKIANYIRDETNKYYNENGNLKGNTNIEDINYFSPPYSQPYFVGEIDTVKFKNENKYHPDNIKKDDDEDS